MSELNILNKCKDCGGSKQVRGCGFMLVKCAACNGIGWIEEKPETKEKFKGSVIVDDPKTEEADAPALEADVAFSAKSPKAPKKPKAAKKKKVKKHEK